MEREWMIREGEKGRGAAGPPNIKA